MERKQNQTPQVKVFKCQTWEDFSTQIRSGKGKLIGSRIYRGHARLEWKLSSIFERWLLRLKGGDPNRNVRKLFSSPKAFDRYRDSYLERFKDFATGLPELETKSLSDNDWWVLGRQYGLITPLLDWTRSPYVAAFFAFIDYADRENEGFIDGLASLGLVGTGGLQFGSGSVAVWALVMADQLEKKLDFKVIIPRLDFSVHAHRVRVQQSVFTRLTHDVHVDLESYLSSQKFGQFLERYEIPGQEFGKALADLELMNITLANLFPDLGGAARHANLLPSLISLGETGIVK